MTHRGPFQPLTFCDSVITKKAAAGRIRKQSAFSVHLPSSPESIRQLEQIHRVLGGLRGVGAHFGVFLFGVCFLVVVFFFNCWLL